MFANAQERKFKDSLDDKAGRTPRAIPIEVVERLVAQRMGEPPMASPERVTTIITPVPDQRAQQLTVLHVRQLIELDKLGALANFLYCDSRAVHLLRLALHVDLCDDNKLLCDHVPAAIRHRGSGDESSCRRTAGGYLETGHGAAAVEQTEATAKRDDNKNGRFSRLDALNVVGAMVRAVRLGATGDAPSEAEEAVVNQLLTVEGEGEDRISLDFSPFDSVNRDTGGVVYLLDSWTHLTNQEQHRLLTLLEELAASRDSFYPSGALVRLIAITDKCAGTNTTNTTTPSGEEKINNNNNENYYTTTAALLRAMRSLVKARFDPFAITPVRDLLTKVQAQSRGSILLTKGILSILFVLYEQQGPGLSLYLPLLPILFAWLEAWVPQCGLEINYIALCVVRFCDKLTCYESSANQLIENGMMRALCAVLGKALETRDTLSVVDMETQQTHSLLVETLRLLAKVAHLAPVSSTQMALGDDGKDDDNNNINMSFHFYMYPLVTIFLADGVNAWKQQSIHCAATEALCHITYDITEKRAARLFDRFPLLPIFVKKAALAVLLPAVLPSAALLPAALLGPAGDDNDNDDNKIKKRGAAGFFATATTTTTEEEKEKTKEEEEPLALSQKSHMAMTVTLASQLLRSAPDVFLASETATMGLALVLSLMERLFTKLQHAMANNEPELATSLSCMLDATIAVRLSETDTADTRARLVTLFLHSRQFSAVSVNLALTMWRLFEHDPKQLVDLALAPRIVEELQPLQPLCRPKCDLTKVLVVARYLSEGADGQGNQALLDAGIISRLTPLLATHISALKLLHVMFTGLGHQICTILEQAPQVVDVLFAFAKKERPCMVASCVVEKENKCFGSSSSSSASASTSELTLRSRSGSSCCCEHIQEMSDRSWVALSNAMRVIPRAEKMMPLVEERRMVTMFFTRAADEKEESARVIEACAWGLWHIATGARELVAASNTGRAMLTKAQALEAEPIMCLLLLSREGAPMLARRFAAPRLAALRVTRSN